MLFNDEGAWIGKHRQEVWGSLSDGYDKRVRIRCYETIIDQCRDKSTE